MLPRWLPIGSAIESGMLAHPGISKPGVNLSLFRKENETQILSELERSRTAWRKNNNISDAEELLTIAVISGKHEDDDVQSAAFEVAKSQESGSSIRSFAGRIIDGSADGAIGRSLISSARLYEEIRKRKKILALNPRDALLLTETALCHVNLGQFDQCEALLRRAVALEPHSRFVLRSTARFYCHIDQPDRALRLLRNTPRHQTDPWLKSAELAVSSLAGEKIRQWRNSRGLAENESLSPRDRSELAVEIATLEFGAGARRAALRKVQAAAADPTENATAQVEFLSWKTGDFERSEIIPDISKSMEAKAVNCYWKGELRSALSACEKWQELEPFSTRPAIFGSFLSTTKSNSIERGLRIAERGMVSNPQNSILLNNLAVLWAYKGDLNLAHHYSTLAGIHSEDRSDIANTATKGLILFKEGKIDEAIHEYERAIEAAVKERRIDLSLRAYAFLAREMCLIDPNMKPYFQEEFAAVEKKLKRYNLPFPRDVAIIRNEFIEVGSNLDPLLRDFPTFSDSYIERAIEP